MATIRCDAQLLKIGSWTLLRLPKSASAQLPSRAMTMVEGTINDSLLKLCCPSPDGNGSHWLRVDETMHEGAGAAADAGAGGTAILEIESAKEWTEPQLPEDLRGAFETDPQVRALWIARQWRTGTVSAR